MVASLTLVLLTFFCLFFVFFQAPLRCLPLQVGVVRIGLGRLELGLG